MKFNISKNRYYQKIGNNKNISKKEYSITLRKLNSRKLELFYPKGILDCFEYFNFIGEVKIPSIKNLIGSIRIEINENDEIVSISNLAELNEQLQETWNIISKTNDANLDEVQSKFSYLFQDKSRIHNIIWKDVDLLLEDYFVKFQDDSYIDFNELEKISDLNIDLCQNYIDSFDDYIIEYLEVSDSKMGRKNDLKAMGSLFLANELKVEKLKSISLRHRKYVYDQSDCSLKSVLLYQKMDSNTAKELNLVKIERA